MKKLLKIVLLLNICAVLSPLLIVGLPTEDPVEVFAPEIAVSENVLTVSERPSYDETTSVRLCIGGAVQEMPPKD